MTEASDLAKYASKANAVFNSITANATAITALSVGGASINATAFAGAANSATYANSSVSNTFTVGTAAYFVANGNVGIGNTAPNAKLTVTGTANVSGNVAIGGALTSANLTTSTNTATFGTAAYVVANGNVGIGTSSPGYPLTINRAGATDSYAQWTNGGGGNFIIGAVSSGDALLYNAANTAMVLNTNSLERMRIAANGFVGIGTSSPGSYGKLAVASSGSTGIGIQGNGQTVLSFFNAAGSLQYTLGRSVSSDNAQNFFLYDNAAAATRLLIDSSGSVGIGASPGYKLDVQGTSGSSIVSRGWSANNTQSSQIHFMATNNGGTGDTNVAGYTFHCAGSYATHMHLRADGFIGMGGWSATAWRWYVNMGNGDMVAAGNVTAYSDPRLKEDIKKIDDPLGKVLALNGVRFRWKQSSVIGHPGEHDYGVLADEVEAVMPELVRGSVFEAPEGDTYKTVSYDKLVPVLIEAIKEQQIQIDKLREEITLLKQG